MNALVAVVSRVYALSTAAPSRRLRLVTVCSKRLIVSATWVTRSVLVVAVWLLPLLDAGVPGISFEKTFLWWRPSLCLWCRNDRAMIRWICGVKPSDDSSMDDLHAKLGICDLAVLVRERWLRWFGHVIHSNGEINRVRSRPALGGRVLNGRRKLGMSAWSKIWKYVVYLRLALRIVSWRSSVKNRRQEPTPSSEHGCASGTAHSGDAHPLL